jgi:hypothetical protein
MMRALQKRVVLQLAKMEETLAYEYQNCNEIEQQCGMPEKAK